MADRRKGGCDMENESLVRKELVALLCGGNAHITFEDLVADFARLKSGDQNIARVGRGIFFAERTIRQSPQFSRVGAF